MVQLEVDYLGGDYSINAKTFNPSPVLGTGIFTIGALQSISKRIAVGAEFIFQRLNKKEQDFGITLQGKVSAMLFPFFIQLVF